MIIYVTISFKAGIVPTRRRQAYHRRPRPGRTKESDKRTQFEVWQVGRGGDGDAHRVGFKKILDHGQVNLRGRVRGAVSSWRWGGVRE